MRCVIFDSTILIPKIHILICNLIAVIKFFIFHSLIKTFNISGRYYVNKDLYINIIMALKLRNFYLIEDL